MSAALYSEKDVPPRNIPTLLVIKSTYNRRMNRNGIFQQLRDHKCAASRQLSQQMPLQVEVEKCPANESW